MEVQTLDTKAAVELLVAWTGEADERAAAELAEELGGLPLALAQAAAYIQATGMTLAAYLPLFEHRRTDLLARGETPGHPSDVTTTLGLAVSRLETETPTAAGLLRLLACLAPEPIPLPLLLSDPQALGNLAPEAAGLLGTLLGDPVAAGDAISALRRYSLITPAGDGLILVHRLVQTITLGQLPAGTRRRWEQAAAVLVEIAIPSDTTMPAAWPVCALLLPHARAVLHLASTGMRRIASYLGSSGSYPAARDLWRLVADACNEDETSAPSTQTP